MSRYRKFDEDFKAGAVRVVEETGKPIAQVARDLGVNEGTLGNWVAGRVRPPQAPRQEPRDPSRSLPRPFRRQARTIAGITVLRDHVIAPILAGVHRPGPGQPPNIYTRIDRDYGRLRDDMRTLFHDLTITTAA